VKAFLPRLPGIVLCVFCLSCGRDAVKSPVTGDSVPPTDSAALESRTVPAMSVEDAIRLPEGREGRRIILEKGNVWTNGIPGFGENALPALSGTYSVTTPGGTVGSLFAVWLCRETLYYDDWDIRTGIWSEDFRVMEKYGRDGLLVAVPFSEIWTGIFSFPGDSELSQSDIDRIIGIYRSRFLYFLTLARSSSDVSLPAQADF
jgi:hypothetical protein